MAYQILAINCILFFNPSLTNWLTLYIAIYRDASATKYRVQQKLLSLACISPALHLPLSSQIWFPWHSWSSVHPEKQGSTKTVVIYVCSSHFVCIFHFYRICFCEPSSPHYCHNENIFHYYHYNLVSVEDNHHHHCSLKYRVQPKLYSLLDCTALLNSHILLYIGEMVHLRSDFKIHHNHNIQSMVTFTGPLSILQIG